MAIHLHPGRLGRVLFSIHARPFSIGRIARTNGTEAVVPEAVAKQKRPVGGFRGGYVHRDT